MVDIVPLSLCLSVNKFVRTKRRCINIVYKFTMPNTVRHVFILAWYYFTTAASCREQSISLRVVELCSCIFLLYALAPFSTSFLPLLLAKIRPSTFPLILIFIPTFKLCSQWWKKKKKLLICDKKNINYKRKNLKESFRTLRKFYYTIFKFVLQ